MKRWSTKMPSTKKISRPWRTKLLLGLLPGLLLAACTHKDNGLRLGEAVKGDLIQRVTVSGLLIPKKKSLIVAPYAGYVQKLMVNVGDLVKEQQPLVRVVQSLNNPNEVVFPLRSPFTGQVVQVFKTDGEAVEATGDNAKILRIDDLTGLSVEANVPEVDIRKVKIGQAVVVKAAAVLERSYAGVVTRIFLAAKEAAVSERGKVEFPVQIDLKDFDSQLKPGMSVVIDVVAAKAENVLTLRQEFLQKEGEKIFVTLEDGTKKEIQIGLQNEEMVEVKGGLSEKQKVKMTDFSPKGS